MFPQENTHTLNLLKTICQKAMLNVKRSHHSTKLILPQIKSSQLNGIKTSKINSQDRNEKSYIKLKLGQNQLNRDKSKAKKYSKPQIENYSINMFDFSDNQSLKIFSYNSNLSNTEKVLEVHTSSRIKNRRFKFNSIQL